MFCSLGGENIHFFGHGKGTLNGNGDAWYHFFNGTGNLHGRPHAITITNTINSVIEGLRFINSQMWTMTIIRSERVLAQDIYVNNTAHEGKRIKNVNTDGLDTAYANNITLLRWTVDNGDDSIALKQNSTNIYIADSTFWNGEGLAIGSIGQYPGQIEIIENVVAERITCKGTRFAARVKTWTGMHKGYPPNGGGGGLGHAKNMTFRNFELHGMLTTPFMITQCIAYSKSSALLSSKRAATDTQLDGAPGGCDTSRFGVDGVRFIHANGSTNGVHGATLQCSKEAPCKGVDLSNNHLTHAGKVVTEYLCSNVGSGAKGFTCTGNCDKGCNE